MTSFEIAYARAQKTTPSFRVTFSSSNASESFIINAPDKGQALMRVFLYAVRTFGHGHYAGWDRKVTAYKGGAIESTTTDLRNTNA
jgi:hypothetical protein